MLIRCTGVLILVLCLLLSTPALPAFGQVRGSLNSGGRSGLRGKLSGPRSGFGLRNNPIANPAPSLTPSQIFNPRGSLSPGQVLNPAPSLFRPRSGVSASDFNRSNQHLRPAGSRPRSNYLNVAPGGLTVTSDPVGENVKTSATALEQQLQRIAPKKGWEHYLALDTLQNIPPTSDHPSTTEEKAELETILSTYQSVDANKQYAVITQLPEFAMVGASLREYLTPVRDRQRRELLFYLDLLKEELGTYPNGGRWIAYFDLPAENQPNKSVDQDPISNKQLQKILKRIEKIGSNAEYERVNSLATFQLAHSAFLAFKKQSSENAAKVGSTESTSTP